MVANEGSIKWMLQQCWQRDPTQRPNFNDIVYVIEQELERGNPNALAR